MALEDVADRYPRTVKLEGGGEVQIRLMGPRDRDAVLAFARALPEEDLLFLRIDITDPAVVDEWVRNLETGFSTSLVAVDGDQLVGYATVHRTSAPWTRRVGELRVNVAPDYRGKGLGRNLTSQIFDVARALDLKKLMANMTADQRGARAAFQRLGFMPEALLADYVTDRKGHARDLIIMSYDVEGMNETLAEPLRL